jgi:hypothetical protein
LRLWVSGRINGLRRVLHNNRECSERFRTTATRNHEAALIRIMELEARSQTAVVTQRAFERVTQNHEAALIRIMELELRVDSLTENVDALEADSPTVINLTGRF